MRLIIKLLTLMFLSYIVASCASTKGYLGEKLPDSELAIVNGSSNAISISGKMYKEQVLIAKVYSLEVGNYYKGWPNNLRIKPGEQVIEVRHFRPWTFNNQYKGGGAIGGAISGSTNEKNMVHYHYLLKFNVEKNQSYLINIQSNTADLENPTITIQNNSTKKNIDFESEEKLVNVK